MPLLRGVARTAVIAGTATAVSNRVSRRQANKWAEQDGAQYQEQQQQYQEPAPAAAPAADPLEQLKQLGELKDSGVLTEAEFEAQKAKILAAAERRLTSSAGFAEAGARRRVPAWTRPHPSPSASSRLSWTAPRTRFAR